MSGCFETAVAFGKRACSALLGGGRLSAAAQARVERNHLCNSVDRNNSVDRKKVRQYCYMY